ncbi:S41 family peptidase [Pelagibius litoralis]|uniref:S41 family peptidase n=1 Tax=Pelagibius litoralis TaxID=374515 RepID=A0A967C2E4_9PROT|nr:S41 family peptidase [Pelagibius litoralis]NIA68288.1 S41 family peptidase [Pelagibius litoralis]
MRKLQITALVAALFIVLPQVSVAQEDRSETYRQLKLFSDVFERVRADYVEEVTDEQLIEFAIQGMLSTLDPHSSYLNADSFGDMRVQTKGEFGGLGIEVTMENGFVKVVSPIDDTPAARAGVEPGDFITHLDGEAILGLTLNEAVEKMRGPVNTDLNLTIRREGQEPFDLTLTRDVIKIRSVRSRVEDNVGYVRITTFNQQTTPGLKKAIEEIKAELGSELKGYVIDLRNNPGGLLDQAIDVSDAFIGQGEIVSTRGRVVDDSQRFNAKGGDLAEGLPIVVLINGGSASASEIVAGALQDHRRAIIMGTRSFGKGSVQTIIPLGLNGAMRLTTARYFTPSGRSIQALGIDPDILVEAATIETPDTNGPGRREADLRGALDNPNGENGLDEGTPPVEGETEPHALSEAAAQDYQLARAIDLLRGLALYNRRVVN